ncbi:MAG: glycosyltransferase family 4 protein [Chloroflexi bacterium]|nr:glycosyltransferase family 4 protein [Chloroflexota bacterium]
MPKRILYVQTGHGVGGAKISLAHLINSRAFDAHIQLVLSSTDDEIFTDMVGDVISAIHTLYLPSWYKNETNGILQKLVALLGKIRRGWYVFPTLRLAFIILRNRVDLIHTNSSVTPVGALAAKLTNRPHVWHIREPIGEGTVFPLAHRDRLSAWIIRQIGQEIICISEYTSQFFIQYGIKFTVILNGINTRDFNESKNRGNFLREKFKIGHSTIVIGMIGSLLADWKEHDLFLMAMALVLKQYPNTHFIVYGGASNLEINDDTIKLNQMVIDLGLTNHIVWSDYIDDIPAILSSLDIVVHPVSREGSGRVVMEAMAAGKPVVAVKAGGVQELIEHGVTGYLVEAKNPQALAKEVLNLISSPESMEKISKRGRNYAHNHFSHERTASQIKAIYNKVLERSSIL